MTDKLDRDLDRRFFVQPTNALAASVHGELRRGFRELAALVAARVPPGRERSLALTKLEEGMFWANAGAARPAGDGDGDR